jgi:hypothetical protein
MWHSSDIHGHLLLTEITRTTTARFAGRGDDRRRALLPANGHDKVISKNPEQFADCLAAGDAPFSSGTSDR